VLPRHEGRMTIPTMAASARLTCVHCALVREWDGRLHVVDEQGHRHTIERSRHGGRWIDTASGRAWPGGDLTDSDAHDPFFGLALWLHAECCGGHSFWANNPAHLDFLEAFIAADQRSRPVNMRTLTWGLPAWMKDAKNRDELLRHVSRLRATLA
jgi:hypothetical protein